MMFSRQIPALIVSALAMSACRGQTSTEPPIVPFRGMHEMPRYDAQERSRYYGDHRTMRPEVPGTIPQEAEVEPEFAQGLTVTGAYVPYVPARAVENAARGSSQPGAGALALVERGRDRFGIYCTSCHGVAGDGRGMVAQRAGNSLNVSSLHDDRLLHVPDGQIFQTITNGIRTMPSLRPQIPVQDRWAIVAYVRALQLSQSNPAAADTDNDGVFGAADRCPTEVEDQDGFADGDGCPDPDNDGDGVLDAADECPTVPGVGTGCPTAVRIEGTQLRILQQIQFEVDSATIRPESEPVLQQVLQAINANPQIGLLRIEGHTDATGDAAANLRLSAARAESVRTWLTSHGVSASRLISRGLGAERAIADNATPEGQEQNRRVEFHIQAELE